MQDSPEQLSLPIVAISRVQMVTASGVVVHTYNPSTQETEAEGSEVQAQPGLPNKKAVS
jgi:hypothetical protein